MAHRSDISRVRRDESEPRSDEAPVTSGSRFIDAVNPVTLFAAAVLYSIPMLTTIDVVSAVTGLALSLALLFAAGVPPRDVVRRAWPLFIAAPVSATSMLLYGKPGGAVHFEFLAARVTDNSIGLAVAIGLRVLAIGVPTLVVLGGIDPTRLADGLAQVAKLPARFVLGALAGIRLFAVFRDDWTAMAQARRARGLGDHGALHRALTMAFALLVLAIRRAGTLALAMEARGFGAGPRTWARPSTLGARDAIVVAAAVLVAAVAIVVAVVTGSYAPLGSGTS